MGNVAFLTGAGYLHGRGAVYIHGAEQPSELFMVPLSDFWNKYYLLHCGMLG